MRAASSAGRNGWMTVMMLICAIAVLDFSPILSLLEQEPLAEFVTYVGLELFQQYIDTTTQSGVFAPAASEGSVQNAILVLQLASNLTSSPRDAGRASLRLGDIKSRHLGDWRDALASYRRAEDLLAHQVEPKYQVARCYMELGLFETAADKLREVIRVGNEAAADPVQRDDPQERYLYDCLGPFEFAKLIFGPTNKDHVVERAKRLVHVQDGDIELVGEGLARAVSVCPPSMHQGILPYKSLSEWNIPKDKRLKGPKAKPQASRRDRKRKMKTGHAKKVVTSFLDFVDTSGLRRLTADLVALPSDTVVQVGAPLTWMDEPAESPPLQHNSQPLQQDHVLNNLVGEPAATPVETGGDEGSLVLDAMEMSQWHSGYKRLSLHEELFSRIESVKASLEADCSQLRAVILAYDGFIDAHKRQIIPILEGDSRPLLATWKNHNQQLRSLCPLD
eukprot:TRINITY_DN24948_c0_g1_i1.p1 TRINITY_DN24948_c0_g1~~TRINITY_DN24948_c0_g1_i1.p1  ORF type:complete len:449 (+),score=152.00 TRINITY_DN24948_c0_g1_i1:64-1410(+)